MSFRSKYASFVARERPANGPKRRKSLSFSYLDPEQTWLCLHASMRESALAARGLIS
jgi:hypothetical protein